MSIVTILKADGTVEYVSPKMRTDDAENLANTLRRLTTLYVVVERVSLAV
jgi:hypothetical protein